MIQGLGLPADTLSQALDLLRSFAFWLQIVVLAGAAGLAYAFYWFWWVHRAAATPREGLWRVTLGGARRAVPPFAMLVLVLAGESILQQFGQPVWLLRVAVPLLVSLAVIRLTVYLLRESFSPTPALKTWEQSVSLIIWLAVALHLLGWLPGILQAMDELAITLGEMRVSLLAVVKLLVLGALALMLAFWLAGVIERGLSRAHYLSAGMRVGLAKFSRFLLLTVALLVALNGIGIDLTALTVFGGALGVGLGFGLQRIASNFISGFILVFDRSIRPGDVITVGDSFGWVKELRARYVVIRNRDGVETLIPNENLITSEVINWSYSDRNVRVKVPVQISYEDDPEKALQLMIDVARSTPRVLDHPPPVGRLLAFGDSGIDLELRAWISDPEGGVNNVRSDINLAVWRAFKEHGVTIPFPQRDVHVKNLPPAR